MPSEMFDEAGGGNLTCGWFCRGCEALGRGVDADDREKLFNKFLNVLTPPGREPPPGPGVAPAGQMS